MSDLEIARDDVALSAIASGNAPGSDDPTLLLLASYRADLEQAASPETFAAPVVPLRKRRRAAMIALSAAAGIVVGGLTAGAVVAADRPGESLHAVHAAVFGEARTGTDEVTTLLDDAAGMLARGDRPAARRLLGRASTLIPGVPESDRPALRRRLDDLSAYAAEPARPTPSPSATQRSPEPSETPEPSESRDDNSGPGSGSGSGSDDSGGDDSSGSGSSSSGSGSSGSGSGSGSGSSGSGSGH